MDIRLEPNYAITSDENNIILNRVLVRESGKDVGKEYYKPLSYHGTFKTALAALRERDIRLSKAQTLDALIQDVSLINERLASL